ncbi:hypothetical protein Tco_0444599 [Tanacetum coccineum]
MVEVVVTDLIDPMANYLRLKHVYYKVVFVGMEVLEVQASLCSPLDIQESCQEHSIRHRSIAILLDVIHSENNHGEEFSPFHLRTKIILKEFVWVFLALSFSGSWDSYGLFDMFRVMAKETLTEMTI